MSQYQLRVDDIRVAKVPTEIDDENKHWIWRFEIDGSREFVTAKSEQDAGDYVAEMDWIDEDEQYDDWRR